MRFKSVQYIKIHTYLGSEAWGNKTRSPILDVISLGLFPKTSEPYFSHVQQPCKITGTKGSVYVRKELNFHWTGLVHQHGHRLANKATATSCAHAPLKLAYGRHGLLQQAAFTWLLPFLIRFSTHQLLRWSIFCFPVCQQGTMEEKIYDRQVSGLT